MTEHSEHVLDMVCNSEAAVYVCGAACMVKDVIATFTAQLSKFRHVASSDAETELAELYAQGRFIADGY